MGYISKQKTYGHRASSLQSGIIQKMPSAKRVGQVMDDKGQLYPFTEAPPLGINDQVTFKVNSDGHAFQIKKP